ncbi:arylamine N-acetyltransferase [Mechercharimyces sp. CAU 1602]|uniref:arylamine N-acetyltransferase n=1 Tax=Mechercharimyces sp. CAU 1602 TaxID=2973933 RepID=UPI002162C298|nr:arylamine N-acetyltransferase [Mechercharimyces sp. CAU 1602]MCS1352289.1 arylamine N-acetyltransferase [Mechercharimyces sp. CAU 1602]
MSHTPVWIQRYIQFLGITPQSPSADHLSQIITSHLNKIPFENISKLLLFKEAGGAERGIPEPDQYVKQIIAKNLGGTCYSIHYHLLHVLQHLGYKCRWTKLGKSHLAILVQLPEAPKEWAYIDCGSAAPFFSPVFFTTDVEQVSSYAGVECRIEAEPGQENHFRYIRTVNGERKESDWVFSLHQTYTWAEIRPSLQASYALDSTFMKRIFCQLYQLEQGRSIALDNNKLTIRTQDGNVTTQYLHDLDEVKEVMRTEFHLPHLPLEEAIAVLHELGVDVFAPAKSK